MEISIIEHRLSGKLEEDKKYFLENMRVGISFDAMVREFEFAGKKAAMFFINGFCKEDFMQKIMEYLLAVDENDLGQTITDVLQKNIPTIEVVTETDKKTILVNIFAGQLLLLVDGFQGGFVIDARSYPSRSIAQPDKDKTLRGSKDGFVETLICNTALIRRRIRDKDLCVEIMQAGKVSKTDIAIVYMDSRVDHEMLRKIQKKIMALNVDALTMTQQSLSEALYEGTWLNPFPKYRYTERPDTTAAQILEGNIAILVDNSPQAMILPTSLFDILEEADDYYFPPVTGTYLRFARYLITLLSYFISPLFLLLMNHPEWVPGQYDFILLAEKSNLPVFWQFLIIEIALDGLKLAAVNTPNMLSTPLSIMAALILGDFSVSSGWFNAEVMLYMAFIAIANYTQTNYELSYAIKFMRIITMALVQFFDIPGFIAGLILFLFALTTNRTLSGKGYLYPLIPLNVRELKKRIIRRSIKKV